MVFLGGGVLFGVLELRDWRAEKEAKQKAEQAVAELQQRKQQLQDEIAQKKHRSHVFTTLQIMLMDMEGSEFDDDVYDKLKAAYLGEKTDTQVKQLFEEAVAISIKADGDEEEWQTLEQLLLNYSGTDIVKLDPGRRSTLSTLRLILYLMKVNGFNPPDGLYDKLEDACFGKKTDKRVEQLFEEAVAISIKTEGKNDGGEEEHQKLKQLLRSYYGLKDVP